MDTTKAIGMALGGGGGGVGFGFGFQKRTVLGGAADSLRGPYARAGPYSDAQRLAIQQRNKKTRVLQQLMASSQQNVEAGGGGSMHGLPPPEVYGVTGRTNRVGQRPPSALPFDVMDPNRGPPRQRVHNEAQLIEETLEARRRIQQIKQQAPDVFSTWGLPEQQQGGQRGSGGSGAVYDTPLPSPQQVAYTQQTFPNAYTTPHQPFPVGGHYNTTGTQGGGGRSGPPSSSYRAIIPPGGVGQHLVGVESKRPVAFNVAEADPNHVCVTDVHKILNKRKAVSEQNFHELLKLFDKEIRTGASLGRSWTTLRVPLTHSDVYYEDADQVFRRVKKHYLKQGFRVRVLSDLQRVLKVSA